MKKITARAMVVDAVLIALYYVLSMYVSINLGSVMRITLDGLPILIGAFLFGPVHGLIIGMLGSFLNQLMSYGLGVTTLLWMLPAMIRGLMVGIYAKHWHFDLSRSKTIFICVLSAIVVTLVNTGVMYVDSIIWHYSAAVFALIIPRCLIGIATGVVFALIMPTILKLIKKNIKI